MLFTILNGRMDSNYQSFRDIICNKVIRVEHNYSGTMSNVTVDDDFSYLSNNLTFIIDDAATDIYGIELNLNANKHVSGYLNMATTGSHKLVYYILTNANQIITLSSVSQFPTGQTSRNKGETMTCTFDISSYGFTHIPRYVNPSFIYQGTLEATSLSKTSISVKYTCTGPSMYHQFKVVLGII